MFTMLQDTREQSPLHFPTDPMLKGVSVKGLVVGDYMVEFADGTRPPVAFERKSLADLAGTLTKGYERFKAEWLRAQEAKVSLILVIEDPLKVVWNGYQFSQESGQSLVQRCFTLMVKYRLQTVFCQDRREAARWILEYGKALARVYQPTGVSR